MGNSCASPNHPRKANLSQKWQSTAKIIHINGALQEFHQPIKASHVLSQNPNCFLRSSEDMYIDCYVPHLSPEKELQLGHIYFLLPLSKSDFPLSLPELCDLAIKASRVLNPEAEKTPFLQRNGDFGFCKVRSSANVPERRGRRPIKL